MKQAENAAFYALKVLAGFAKSFQNEHPDVLLNINQEPKTGVADNGDLESDLTALMIEIGKAIKSVDRVFVLFVHRLDLIQPEELSALLHALHDCNRQSIPFTTVGSGAPNLRGLIGRSKPYAERLFHYTGLISSSAHLRNAISKTRRN